MFKAIRYGIEMSGAQQEGDFFRIPGGRPDDYVLVEFIPRTIRESQICISGEGLGGRSALAIDITFRHPPYLVAPMFRLLAGHSPGLLKPLKSCSQESAIVTCREGGADVYLSSAPCPDWLPLTEEVKRCLIVDPERYNVVVNDNKSALVVFMLDHSGLGIVTPIVAGVPVPFYEEIAAAQDLLTPGTSCVVYGRVALAPPKLVREGAQPARFTVQ